MHAHFLVEAALVNKLILAVLGNPSIEILEKEGEEEQSFSSSRDMPIISNETELAISLERQANNQDLESVEDKLGGTEIEKIHDFYDGIKDKSIPVANVDQSNELVKLENCLINYKESLAKTSRTAKLWLQYIEYVEIVKLFIRAERTGNWNLHLVAVGNMMNLFAATGHINCAKSSRLYLQLMLELPTNHPWLYECFIERGFHSVRRSSRYWAGLWTDLIIEQVMM